MAAGRSGGAPAEGLTAGQTEEVRTRVRLLIQITARAGKYRKGLLAAAAGLSPEEAAYHLRSRAAGFAGAAAA